MSNPIKREYSLEQLLEIMHDHELSNGNDPPPATGILVEGDNAGELRELKPGIIVVYDETSDG